MRCDGSRRQHRRPPKKNKGKTDGIDVRHFLRFLRFLQFKFKRKIRIEGYLYISVHGLLTSWKEINSILLTTESIPVENIRDFPRYIRGLSKPELLPRFVQVSTSQVASMRLDMQKKKEPTN